VSILDKYRQAVAVKDASQADPLSSLDSLLTGPATPAPSAPAANDEANPASRAKQAAAAEPDADEDAAASKVVQEVNKAGYFMSSRNGTPGIFRKYIDPVSGGTRVVAVPEAAAKQAWANVAAYIATPGGGGTASVRKVNPISAWLQSPKRADYPHGIGMFPEGAPAGTFNLYEGWSTAPTAGDASLMLEHVEMLCGGRNAVSEYVLNWLAFGAQRPSGTPGTALVFRGGQGTGKGSLITSMVRLYGAHGLHITQAGQLTGRFNAHFEGALFVFADEATFADDRGADGTLKALVSEQTISLEAKFGGVWAIPNRLKIVMASNSSWVIPAGADERRYCVVDVSGARARDYAYFDRLHSWLQGDGLGIWLHYLLHRDISQFDPRRIPATEALDLQKIHAMGPIDRWLMDALDTGAALAGHGDWPRDDDYRLACVTAVESFDRYCGLTNMRSRTDARTLGRRLNDVFACGPAHGGGKDGGRYWLLPPLAAARESAAAAFGLKCYVFGRS
jgi:hypothetical protein